MQNCRVYIYKKNKSFFASFIRTIMEKFRKIHNWKKGLSSKGKLKLN